MKKTFFFTTILCCCFFAAKGQTDFFNIVQPQFVAKQRLLTDSMVIESPNNISHFSQVFDSKGRVISYTDSTFNADLTLASIRLGQYVHTTLKSILTYQTTYFSSSPSESLERITTDSLSSDKVKQTTFEYWNGTNWVVNQVNHYTYNAAGQLTEMWSENWDFQSMKLQKAFANLYEYDAKGQRVKYQTASWDTSNNKWLVKNEYVYAYNTAGSKISETWNNLQNNALKPVQLATYRYDAAGKVDSIKYYDTFFTTNWRYYSYTLLDDSPEQQTTQKGRTFKLNGQGVFEPATNTIYIPGPQVYSTLFKQELTQIYTQVFSDSERALSDFSTLPDGRILGLFERDQYTNGSWKPTFKVRGWLRKPGSVATHAPRPTPVAHCGLPNPLTPDVLDEKLRALPGVVSIRSTDGKTVGHSAPPGLYWITVTDKGQARCAQKVLIH